ncbi:MAG: YfiT family bacillithiol transferase [Planctomycetota bacterium]
MDDDPPRFPVGPFVSEPLGPSRRRDCIAQLGRYPRELRAGVQGLGDSQLDEKYRNWTIRQIVHHIADSHLNSYVRFKWALTEDTPMIKAYDEGLWSDLVESRSGDVTPSIQLIDGLHARWCQLLSTLTDDQFGRCFLHPETNETNSLESALAYYAWHGAHHLGQIQWLRQRKRV